MAVKAVIAILQTVKEYDGKFDHDSDLASSLALDSKLMKGSEKAVIEAVFGPDSQLPESAQEYYADWIGVSSLEYKYMEWPVALATEYIRFLENGPSDSAYIHVDKWICSPCAWPKNMDWDYFSVDILKVVDRILESPPPIQTDRCWYDFALIRILREELRVARDIDSVVTLDTFLEHYKEIYPLEGKFFEDWSDEAKSHACLVLCSKMGVAKFLRVFNHNNRRIPDYLAIDIFPSKTVKDMFLEMGKEREELESLRERDRARDSDRSAPTFV